MSKAQLSQMPETFLDEPVADDAMARARPVPRISIECFADDPAFVNALEQASADRRLSKVTIACANGGIAAAMNHYSDNPTPDLIILDSSLVREELLAELDALAGHCDAGTKVIVCGRVNDVLLYRELLKRGVSEYLVTPVNPQQILESVSNLYNDPSAAPIGHVIAFIGAKGGVGSSTVCHNTAWCLSEQLKANVIIADFDLAFGTSGLDFNQDPVQGIAEALAAPERVDEVMLDRLLTKCSNYLSIFAPPATLDRDYDLDAEHCDTILSIMRRNVPFVALDIPHGWTSWTKRLLMQADDIVIVAEPDLANLRNAKNMFDVLKAARRNDQAPILVVNRANTPKRPEIPVKDFCQSIDIRPTAVIEFDSESFGQAANNGQMIEEIAKKSKSVAQFRELARVVSRRKDFKPPVDTAPASPVSALIDRLRKKL